MRNRNNKINIFLSDEEKRIFDEKAKSSGLNKSEFFRKIILGYKLKEKPDPEFYEMLKLLRGMAINVNQIAMLYNQTHNFRGNDFIAVANQINKFILDMQRKYLIPQKSETYGSYKDVEI